MKKYISYLIGLFISLGIISCVDDGGDNCSPSPVENGEVTRTFTLQLPSLVESASTYGMSPAAENAILTLDLLAFEIASDGKEIFAYHVQATSIEDTGSNPRYKKATVKLKVSDTRYRFVFLANITDEVEALIPIAQAGEKDQLLARLLHEHEETRQWTTGQHYFPMWGESDELTIDEETDLNENIKMVRSLARIDIVNETTNFKLEGAHLYKYHCKGHVVPTPANMSGAQAHTPTIPNDPVMATRSLLYTTTENQFEQDIYAYESELNAGHYDKTCLVIGGRYYPADFKDTDPEPEITWYRIEFVDDQNQDIHLLRNHCYIFQIKSVKGEGYTDPDEAYESKPFNIDADVLPWDQGSMKDFVYNGQFLLGVSESEIYMPHPEDTVSILVTTNFYVNDTNKGWTATFESADKEGKEWLTHYDGAFTGINQKDPLIFHLTENKDGAMRTGKVHLRAGVLRHTIYVYQDINPVDDSDVHYIYGGKANCYILHPDADGIYIPVSQANADGENRIKSGDKLEAEVIWTDRPYPVGHPDGVIRLIGVEGEGTDGQLKVAGIGNPGNALVAVKVDGVIKWSWHIWVLDYDPMDNIKYYPTSSGTLGWMDRNLGALSSNPGDPQTMGLVYQWGRKDPFPGVSSFVTPTATQIFDKDGKETFIEYPSVINGVTNMINLSVEHPTWFYVGVTSNSSDWYAWSGHNLYLWRTSSGGSTAYDPCPDGWTISLSMGEISSNIWSWGFRGTSSVYGSVSELTSGQTDYLPSAGYRKADGSIDITKVSSEGFYWIGESNGGNIYGQAIKLNMSATTWSSLEIGEGPSKGYGLSVRCIKK